MDLNDLRYFALIVQHGGFSAAARHTHLSKSKLSRRVAELEGRLGARLLQRSTRRLALTEAGRIYYEHCAAMLIEAEAAQTAIERLRSEPAGTVRMACPVAMAHSVVAERLAEFMRQHPKVRVELNADDRTVNLIDERIDVAVRARDSGLSDPGLIARRLASGCLGLYASPAYFAAQPPLTHPAQLAHGDTIGAIGGGDEQSWTLCDEDGSRYRLTHRPRLLCPDFTVQQLAAVGGVGVALLPMRVARSALQNGGLIRVAPAWATPPQDIHLVYASKRGQLPAVRALIEHLLQSLPDALAG